MAKYMIHACNDRLWYVVNYLIPSMMEQGIDEQDVKLYLDEKNQGCLESCMLAFLSVPIDDEGTWHLQDDVILCSDFKKRTEELDIEYHNNVVCGFCYEKDDRARNVGPVGVKEMWYSFPCIRIPNKLARGCADWYFRYVKFAKEYQVWIHAKKYDDSVFDVYLQDYHPKETILNVKPNLVDHVDYLIGGSKVNATRPEKETHTIFFDDKYLIDELRKKLLTT